MLKQFFFPSAFLSQISFQYKFPLLLLLFAQEGRCCFLTRSLLATKQVGFLMGLQVPTCTQIAQHNRNVWVLAQTMCHAFMSFAALTAWIFKRRKANVVLVHPGAKEQLPGGVTSCLTSITLPFPCTCLSYQRRSAFLVLQYTLQVNIHKPLLDQSRKETI